MKPVTFMKSCMHTIAYVAMDDAIKPLTQYEWRLFQAKTQHRIFSAT